MNSGELIAWSSVTRQPVRLAWNDGVITALATTTVTPPSGQWVAPPLVDLQVNGYGGVDFQRDDLTTDELLSAVRQLRRDGCTRFLLTLITEEWPRLLARLRHLRKLRTQNFELARAIAGWHVEGPFLSAEPGFCGAHDPALMIDPTPEHLRELREVTGTDSVLLTLAPERRHALAAIQQATALGIKVSLGHTNASAELLAQAVQHGAVAFTHLGNGCPRELDRHDNILWRLFELRGVRVSLIPDGIHVAPALFRLMHRELGGENCFYVSDAMAAAGAPPGSYPLGRLALEVGADRIVRYPGRSNFAGSALAPIDGVFRAAEMLGDPWQNVWPRFSTAPARLMVWPTGLAVGASADFCVMKISPEHRLLERQVFADGATA